MLQFKVVNIFFPTSVQQYILIFNFCSRVHLLYMVLVMPIGIDVQPLIEAQLGSAIFLVPTAYLGLPKSNQPCLIPVLKPSMGPWLPLLLRSHGLFFSFVISVYYFISSSNISALHLTVNPMFHAQVKHIEIYYHFVRKKVALWCLVAWYIPSSAQPAKLFRSKLGVFSQPLHRAY